MSKNEYEVNRLFWITDFFSLIGSTMPYVIFMIGTPGSGKTTISNQLIYKLDNLKRISQDQFYNNKKADVTAYLEAIEQAIPHHNLILDKNHHTESIRQQVIEILERHNVLYFMINLFPEELETDSEQEFVLNVLLQRIQERQSDSHLVITDEASYKKARNVLLYGFIKPYQPPTTALRLAYQTPIEEKITQIIEYIKK